MMRRCLTAFLFIFLPGIHVFAQGHEGYRLVWHDEFDRDGRPDEKNWMYEKGFVRNEEAQWYQPDNAYCEDGFLIIEARKERRSNPEFLDTHHRDWRHRRDSIYITSSSLTTRGTHAWQYGRFEMKAKIPVAPGMWPAFWTLGSAGRWPANGEIDIMEYYRGKLLANAAWESEIKGKPAWDDAMLELSRLKFDSDEFHIWRMDWDHESINLYVDDYLVNTINLASTLNGTQPNVNPFHQTHYLLINLAVGGTQGGDPTFTIFPQKYIVDYIRVYQR